MAVCAGLGLLRWEFIGYGIDIHPGSNGSENNMIIRLYLMAIKLPSQNFIQHNGNGSHRIVTHF